MEKWSFNNLQIKAYNIFQEGDLLELYNQYINQRPNFSMDSQYVVVPRYFVRLIGLPTEDEDVYYNHIYEIDKGLQKNGDLYLPLKNGFSEKIEENLLFKLDFIWSKLSAFSNLTSDDVVKMLDGAKVLLDYPIESVSKQIRKNLRFIIEHYFEMNENNINPNDFRQFLFYQVYWINLYFEPLFSKFEYTSVNPKVMYYGEISKEEIYFLLFLSTMGSDILYINPLRNGDFDQIDSFKRYTTKQEYPLKKTIQPFPKERRATRVQTLTKSASQQVEKVLGETNTFFKPWQLTEHKPMSVTLKTTYDEVYILGETEALYRPEWKVEGSNVYIPNIFAKINGVHKNKSQYWKEIWRLTEKDSVCFYKKLPLSENKNYERDYVTYWGSLDHNKKIDPEKLLHSDLWVYKHLPQYMQKNIAYAISELCLRPRWKSPFQKEEDLQVEIFSRLMSIEKKYIQLLQKYDYPKQVPKIVVYNNEKNGQLTWHDSIILVFLNYIGFDVIIYNPASHADIENYVEEKYYDIHRLEEIEFELSYKEKSLLNRLFS